MTGSTYNLSHTNLIVPFIECWTITPQNGQYSIRVDASIVNTTAIRLTWRSNSTLVAASVAVLFADKSVVEENQQRYVDYGFYFAENGVPGSFSFDLPTSSFDFFAFIQGANWFNINTGIRFQVDFSPLPPLNMTTFSSYNYINYKL